MRLGKILALVLLGIPAVMIVTAGITIIAPYLAAGAVIFFIIWLLIKYSGHDPPDGEPTKPP